MKPAVSFSLLRSTASGCKEACTGKSFLPFSSDAVAMTVYPLSRKYLVTTDPRFPLAPVMRMVLGMGNVLVKLMGRGKTWVESPQTSDVSRQYFIIRIDFVTSVIVVRLWCNSYYCWLEIASLRSQ